MAYQAVTLVSQCYSNISLISIPPSQMFIIIVIIRKKVWKIHQLQGNRETFSGELNAHITTLVNLVF